ncbi:hypothetical protein BY996DRAFT_6411178 [Phakopsora pachyrhizi]|nr:hypothetical protein BY996DRAFT_6411178 [Phakopsora pachyrhizi]
MRVGLLLFLTLLVAIRNSKQNPVPPTIVKDGENAYTSLTYKLNTPINKLNFNGQGGIRGEGQISKSKEIYPKKDKKMVEKVDNFHEIASVSLLKAVVWVFVKFL